METKVKMFLILLIAVVTQTSLSLSQTISNPDFRKISIAPYSGPEDMVMDQYGNIYTGVENGMIIKKTILTDSLSVFAKGLGRPLGLCFDDQGNLWVCDAVTGLLKIDSLGNITDPGLRYGGISILFTDGLDIDAQGYIYFTEASCKYSFFQIGDDWGQPNGRVYRYHPGSGEVILLADSLCFANGIALAPDEKSLVVCESSCNRVTRISISEDTWGEKSNLLKDLPGPPDGIMTDTDYTHWIAFFDGDLYSLLPDGTVNIVSVKPYMSKFTSARIYNNSVYLGNLDSDFFGKVILP
jgi:sugar lactone lactonase YvrE